MKREEMLARVRERSSIWDFLVIGGGATGLGIAVDAASRGHSVLLVERDDFAKGTSSRSTKLIHGGVRYLQQGNVALVIEALKERGRLRRNAPHLVHDLAFVVPSYAWWESPFYGIGLKLYDLLAGEYGFGASSHLDIEQVIAAIPNIETKGLLGGSRYFDGQFDDARLAIALAQTAAEQGATLINYCGAVALRKQGGQVRGAMLRDAESGEEFEVAARVVVNAAGPFCDEVRRLDDLLAQPLIVPSRGTHLVLPHDFLPGDVAIMVPHTDDDRVIFVIPWQGRVLVGTTDIAVLQATTEPIPQVEEIEFLLATANRYLARDATPQDILAVFAGIRPLVSRVGTVTASLSREHVLLIDPVSGLLTVAGGKWTTYRRMAEDAVNVAQTLGNLPEKSCRTENLAIVAAGESAPSAPLHPVLPITPNQVLRACREEMARRVEDVLARRSRCLLLDAAAAIAVAPQVARLMAAELGRDESWERREVIDFTALAAGYGVTGVS
ncbi:MAG: glycerol-3-phosphate dehydrogenase/oxidase [Sterolibacterium sp.]|nr:glycerol-3-phosphate dehydrogenase/oxidase [Sterolibacterium sp.]